MLLQAGGLGGPYYAATASAFMTTIGISSPGGPFVWGVGAAPADAGANQIMTSNLSLPTGGPLLFNLYANDLDGWSYQASGPGAALDMDPNGNIRFIAVPSGTAGAVAGPFTLPLVATPPPRSRSPPWGM
jgi:hypothetical protein